MKIKKMSSLQLYNQMQRMQLKRNFDTAVQYMLAGINGDNLFLSCLNMQV